MTYGRLVAPWESLLATFEPYDRQPYSQLALSFRRAGDDQSSNDVYFSQRSRETRIRIRQSVLRFWPSILWDYFIRYLAGYGVRPVRHFGWTMLVLFLGAALYTMPGAAVMDEAGQASNVRLDLMQAFRTSADHLLPVELPSKAHLRLSDAAFLRVGPFDFTYAGAGTFQALFAWVVLPIAIAVLASRLWRERVTTPFEEGPQ
jgi:hypothetical protein